MKTKKTRLQIAACVSPAGPCLNQKGFTLIEVMITVFILVVAILGILSANTAIERSSEGAFERTVAIQDANQVLERMRNTANSGTFPSNVVSAYPQGGAVSGFNNLVGEQAVVSYVDTSADPLDASVTVSWLQNGTRNASVTLRTLITQRT